ncbi:potassium-transporting ATPase KdpC subunit [Acrocarpospora pleiomorpha]|uniref:Potassium-transporting ATPase KdpC subunit n=1 Tax=Acrocarpospora pleiomorpha TaxID=90975 RepID=A0A5M3XGC5_9ACTN|nr:potassium-transporting ATPase subunit C [Acrocarpospora pleiomorpha]GES19812.1 potassium-transporting ATPase KdpC subunit [Acrocarpospora pleiomorpha]
MERLPHWTRSHLVAIRAIVVLTVLTGVIYPLLVMGVGQVLFHHQANGSLVRKEGKTVGSALVGQLFTGKDGKPLARYFQTRPSEAGEGYDMLSTAASNLGPEDIVDALPVPGHAGRKSLLTQVCARSRAAGELEGVSGARPYCTDEGVGAVLKVFPHRVVSVNQPCPTTPFIPKYRGMAVECARPGEDYAAGRTVPVRGSGNVTGTGSGSGNVTGTGSGSGNVTGSGSGSGSGSGDVSGDVGGKLGGNLSGAAVPPDAVTASGSGLDPDISVEYARLQAPRIARERRTSVEKVLALIAAHTTGPALGFLGEPAVHVLELNLALDQAR